MASVLPAVLLSACAVGPDYRRPQLAGNERVGPHFENATVPGTSEGNVEARFWTAFGDPQLELLVAEALASNYSLKEAVAALTAARAATRSVGLDRFPTVTLAAAADRRLASTQQAPGLVRTEREGTSYDAGFDALWELDLVGRVRRSVEAARATQQQVEASAHDVEVIVAAEVVRNYLALRGLQERVAVAERNAEIQRATLRITVERLKAGRGNELDTSRAESLLETTLASIAPLDSAVSTTLYHLAVLTGRQPGALVEQLGERRPLPVIPLMVGVSTPEALLRRRPDVRVAERRIAAATARIGVAVGDLFPRVSLTGSAGYNAATVDALGSLDSQRFTIGPRLTWAAFDLGRVRAQIAVARANADGALAEYQLVVLQALEEAEGALVAFGSAQREHASLERAAAASERAATLAQERFRGGLTDFLNVLDAERESLAAQDALARSRVGTATALVAVYKALGGGWESPPGGRE